MTSAISLVGIFWIIFLVVWLVSAASSKKTVQGGRAWRYGMIIRLVFIIIVFWLIEYSNGRYAFLVNGGFSGGSGIAAIIGVVFCGAGIGFAIWARFYLGKNWGMPMSLKENPELVTSGPYRFVRHPIYTGMLLAMLGSALVIGAVWFAVLVMSAIYFIYSAKKEEQIMTKQFPDQYPAYMKRTKMLIPFVV